MFELYVNDEYVDVFPTYAAAYDFMYDWLIRDARIISALDDGDTHRFWWRDMGDYTIKAVIVRQ